MVTSISKIAAVAIVGIACLVLSSGTTSAGGLQAPEEKIVYDCSAEGPGTDSEICAINPNGTGFENLTNDPLGDTGPELSPDGKHIAYRHDIIEIWVMDPDGQNKRNVAPDVISAFGEPTWSPNGQQIAAYCSDPDQASVNGFCVIDVATGDVAFGHEVEFYAVEDVAWSPDGSRLLFTGEQISGGAHLFVLDFASGNIDQITDTGNGVNEYGTWSPAGDEIAFVGNGIPADGTNTFPNLYRMDPDGDNRELLYDASSLGPSHSGPAYSPDGQQIIWFCSDSEPSAKDICFNDADSGALLDIDTEGDDALVTGSNPDWGYTAGSIFGDINCDGVIDQQDIDILLKHVGGVLDEQPCIAIGTELTISGVVANYKWGDVNCDGVIDGHDALFLLLYLVGIINNDPDCPNIGTVAPFLIN